MSTDIIGLLSTQLLASERMGFSTWLQTHGMVLYMGVNPKIGVGPPLFLTSILGVKFPYFWVDTHI